LSFAQERLWFFDQLEPGSAAYNIPRALRLKGSLDREALQSSIETITERHEVLRASFATDNGKPVLRISKESVCDLIYSELGTEGLSAALNGDKEQAIQRFINTEARQPFELSRAPLFRVSLLKLAENDHLFLLTMHHIISDGWSIAIFLRELAAF